MKVLLAQAPHRDTFGYSMPPPGLLRLAGALLEAGYEVELDDLAHALAAGDLACDDDLARTAADRLLARGSHGMVGLSVMGATVPIAIAILEHMKRARPDVRTVIGGPGTTGIDRELVARFPSVDVVVRGEGEHALVELARAFADDARECAGIAGVTWRAADGGIVREGDRKPIQDLATLPPYAWSLLPSIEDYKRVTGSADGLVALDSGRGCVFDCSFCTIGRFWSRRSRVLPARLLVDDVAAVSAMPGATAAYLCHDIFGANRGHAVAFCEAMLARGIALPWEVRARADHLDDELLELMARAGCYRVLIGVESADAKVRERNQKGMRVDIDLLAVVDGCARVGILPILSLILGLPGEGEAGLRASLDFCADAALRAGVQISLHLVNPQPGCGLYEEFGASARPIEGIPPDMAFGAGDTAPERALREAHPDLFTTWALLPDQEAHLRDLHAIASELPDVLMRHPRTWTLSARRRELDTLDLFRAWKRDGRSFETYARRAGNVDDAVVVDALQWEQAIVRVEARERRGSHGDEPRGPLFRGEIVALAHDVPALTRVAASSASSPTPEEIPLDALARPTWLAVLPGARGIQTLRVGRDAARMLASLDGTRSVDELDAARPGVGSLLERWSADGWIEGFAARSTRTRTQTSVSS